MPKPPSRGRSPSSSPYRCLHLLYRRNASAVIGCEPPVATVVARALLAINVTPRRAHRGAHHMTSTFLNRRRVKIRRALAPKVHRGLSSPHHLRPMSMHRHPCLNDMPKPAATLQLKKTSGTARIPPETCQVRDFPYRESHTDHDARCVKTRSEPCLSTVRLRDFSAGVC